MYSLARINPNTISWCLCNMKVIRFRCIYLSLLLTTTFYLPRGRWYPVLFPPSVNSLISWKGVILGGLLRPLPDEPILYDTPRGLPLVKRHCINVLTCSYIPHILQKNFIKTDDFNIILINLVMNILWVFTIWKRGLVQAIF